MNSTDHGGLSRQKFHELMGVLMTKDAASAESKFLTFIHF